MSLDVHPFLLRRPVSFDAAAVQMISRRRFASKATQPLADATKPGLFSHRQSAARNSSRKGRPGVKKTRTFPPQERTRSVCCHLHPNPSLNYSYLSTVETKDPSFFSLCHESSYCHKARLHCSHRTIKVPCFCARGLYSHKSLTLFTTREVTKRFFQTKPVCRELTFVPAL